MVNNSSGTAARATCPITRVPRENSLWSTLAPSPSAGNDNKRMTSTNPTTTNNSVRQPLRDNSLWIRNSLSSNSSGRRRRHGQQQSQPHQNLNHRPLSTWSTSLIVSLTAITFVAISPRLAFGVSVVGEAQEVMKATAAVIPIAESGSNYSSRDGVVVPSPAAATAAALNGLVDGDRSFNGNVSATGADEDKVRIPSSAIVNLSAMIAGSSSSTTEESRGEDGVDGMGQNHSSSNSSSSSTNSSIVVKNVSVLQGFATSIFCMLIVLTVIGNTLVILSVLTTRRLRTVTNCFVMSLAVADWLVGLFVMPPAVAVYLLDKWVLGRILCDIWISLDVLLCTASILSLCAISIDRYLAVTQPLNYSRRRRSKRLALLMILVVWVLAVAITCPPMLGWYDSAERGEPEDCHYNQNKAYVVYSAMGSFFIPMLVMIYVYVQISCVIAKRHDHMSEIEVHKKGHRSKEVDVAAEMEIDVDNVSEPEPSSPRRTTRATPSTASATTAPAAKQEVGVTSSGGSNSSSNFSKNYKNAQYELVDGVPHVQVQQQHQQQHQSSRQMSTYRSNNETWYNSTSSSTNGPTTQTATTATTKTSNIRVHQKSMSNRILSLKRENKTTQTLAIVVGGFIACWLPFFVIYLISPFLAEDAIDQGVYHFLTWLGWFNSAMNPFIYALYSLDFRAAFWRLTCRRFCKNMRKAPYASNTYSIRRN